MDSFYLVYEVVPQSDNPVIGHVSKAVAHIWIFSVDMDEARHKAFRFLESEHWTVAQEIKAYQPTSEQLDALEAHELSQYQKARSEGIHANFFYWHRSE